MLAKVELILGHATGCSKGHLMEVRILSVVQSTRVFIYIIHTNKVIFYVNEAERHRVNPIQRNKYILDSYGEGVIPLP